MPSVKGFFFTLFFFFPLAANPMSVDSSSSLTHYKGLFHEEYHFPAELLHPEKDLLVFQKLQELWKDRARDFVVYGKVADKAPFVWRVFPISSRSSSWIQQISILFATLFSKPPKGRVIPFQASPLSEPATHPKSSDPFCNPDVIKRQQVKEGAHTRLLVNYAPLLKGSPHFLIISKAHCERLEDLNSSTYQELILSAQKVVSYLQSLGNKDKKPLYSNLHLYHKSGRQAGQTVPHFHLHLVATSSSTQDFWGAYKVLMNIALQNFSLLFNKLSEKDLKQEVAYYKKIF